MSEEEPGRSVELVVAKFREDVTWVLEWAARPSVRRVTVYDKSPDGVPAVPTHPKVVVVPSPNVGRESHAYVTHFLERDDLCDVVVCSQGRHDDHVPREAFEAMVAGEEPPLWEGLDVPWSSSPMRHYGWTVEANWAPDPMLPAADATMADFFLRHVADALVPESRVHWWQGAIFAVPSAAVRRVPVDRLRAIRATLESGTSSNPEASHMMERFWRPLLLDPATWDRRRTSH